MAIVHKLKHILKSGYHQVRRFFPLCFFLIQYRRVSNKMGNLATERDKLFEHLLFKSKEKRCLQIGVKDNYGAKFNPDWISVDLYN